MGKSFAINNLAPTPERDRNAALSGPRRGVGAQIRRLAGLAAFALRFFVLRQKGPFFLAVVTNDSCNLNCIDCRVANTEHRSLSYDETRATLERYYRRGVRFVTFTGGEPYLWRDGARRLGDLVRLAHDIGYLHVNIFTNGTIPLRAGADFTYVSIDGVDEVYRKVRGIPLSRILRNIRPFTGRFAVIHTVNTVNYRDIPAFLDFMRDILNSDACRRRGLYSRAYVELLLAAPEMHFTRIQGSKLWHAALLEYWLQRQVDARAAG